MILRLKRKACLLLDDPHMREIARGTLLAFVLKVVGSGLAFAFNVAVARLLGVEGMGLYYLALAVTTIGSVVGRIGLDNTLLPCASWPPPCQAGGLGRIPRMSCAAPSQ